MVFPSILHARSSAIRNFLPVADLEHGDAEERWFAVGCASNGAVLSLVYLWSDTSAETTTIRIISARKATRNEVRHYQEGI
jgi:uncharacterized DUF497 family protein